jgi:hypothetical protein
LPNTKACAPASNGRRVRSRRHRWGANIGPLPGICRRYGARQALPHE